MSHWVLTNTSLGASFLGSAINGSKYSLLSSSGLDLLDNISISVVEAGSSAKGEKPLMVGGRCGSQNFVTRQDRQLKSMVTNGSGPSPDKDLNENH